ncbi:MAG TPA: hypothetical protein VGM97_10610 [Steroidobacteraceae bacterium]
MRSFVRRLEIRRTAIEPKTAASTGVGALIAICGDNASPELAAQIDKARRAARQRSAQAAMLLRSWMSEHE